MRHTLHSRPHGICFCVRRLSKRDLTRKRQRACKHARPFWPRVYQQARTIPLKIRDVVRQTTGPAITIERPKPPIWATAQAHILTGIHSKFFPIVIYNAEQLHCPQAWQTQLLLSFQLEFSPLATLIESGHLHQKNVRHGRIATLHTMF